MRFATHLNHVLVCVVVGVNAGCSDGTGPKSRTVPNLVRLESSAGDYIGGGETHSYSQANAVITVMAAGARLSFKVTGDEWWVGDLQAPSGLGRLKPGAYGGLPRYSRSDTTVGGISWFGEGRGCLVVTGSFTVDSSDWKLRLSRQRRRRFHRRRSDLPDHRAERADQPPGYRRTRVGVRWGMVRRFPDDEHADADEGRILRRAAQVPRPQPDQGRPAWPGPGMDAGATESVAGSRPIE
jgi:hypothetical protein